MFTRHEREVSHHVFFDVSSDSVGVGIVALRERSVELLWSKRIAFGYQEDEDSNRYIRTMYATLLEAGMKLTSEGVRLVQSTERNFSVRHLMVHCVLGQPWFVGTVHSETYRKEKPFQVTPVILKSVQDSSVASVLAREDVQSWQEIMGPSMPLEVLENRVFLEGYPTVNVLHRTTQELSLTFYISLVSRSVFEHIDEVIKRILPNHEVSYISSTNVFSIAQTFLPENKTKRSILLEVTGEITSVAIKRCTTVTGVMTIPHGKNRILRSMAPNALSLAEAQSALTLLTQKKNCTSIESLPGEVRTALTLWHEAVQHAICELSSGITPPLTMEVVIESEWYPLSKMILEKPWEMPGVRQIQNNDVRSIFENTIISKRGTQNEPVSDARMSVLMQPLNNYTQGKGMCYNTKNSII